MSDIAASKPSGFIIYFAAGGGLEIGLWIGDRLPAPTPTYAPLIIGTISIAIALFLWLRIIKDDGDAIQPADQTDLNPEAETLGLPVNYALDLKQSTSISWPPHKIKGE